METYVARALQVLDLFEDELGRLHATERKIGHYIPNWNIQSVFEKKSLKEAFSLPNDELELSRHMSNVKSILDRSGILIIDDEDIDENGNSVMRTKIVDFLSVPEIHAFDKNVKRKFQTIDFSYLGGSENKKGRLKKLVEASAYA